MALAIGTAVGASLPRTRLEDECLGEARDRLMHEAESADHQALDSLSHT